MATNWEIQGVRLDGKASIDAWDIYVNRNLTVTGTSQLDGFLIVEKTATFNANIVQAHSQTATLNSPVTINNTLDVDPNSGSDEGITILNAGAGQPQLTIGTNSIQEDGSGDMLVDLGNDEVNFESGGTLAKLSMTSTGAGTALISATDSGVSSVLHSNGTIAGWEITGDKLQISAHGASPQHKWYIGSTNISTAGQAISVLGLTESTGNFATGEVVINEDSQDIDFRVESDSTSDALFVDASADKVEVNVNLDITNTTTTVGGDINLTGDITQTGNYGLTGDITASGTTQAITGSLAINLSGDTTVDGTFTNKDTGTNTPIIEMTDSTNTFEVWKYAYDAVNSSSVLTWNPNHEPSHHIKFQDNFGNDSLFILAGITATQVQSYAANWRYRGGANYIAYETAAGANMAKLNMNAGNNFYEQYSGDTEFNPVGSNTANWKFNSNTYTSAGVPLFGLTETSDLIHMSGSIFATALSITNAPLQQLSDTSANLATSMTRDGEIAFSTDANEFVGHKATSESYLQSPSVLTFTQDITSASYGGSIYPNYHVGTPPVNGLKAPFDGYIVGLSVEFTTAPGGPTQMTFAPMINGSTVVAAVVTTAPSGTDIYGSIQPHVAPFSAGDRLGMEMGFIGPTPVTAIGATWVELHVVYKMPII
jgi:hypothetical protein